MKNYRVLVPIVLIVLMIASWYIMASDSVKTETEFSFYLSEARKYAEDGITKYAIENYNSALAIKKTPEIYREVAEYYIKQETQSDYLDWANTYLVEYPTDPNAYEYVLDALLKQEDYKKCFDVFENAKKRNVKSEKLDEFYHQIEWKYKIDFSSYEDVGVYSNSFCAVKVKENWGYIDRFGKLRISTVYKSAGVFNQNGYSAVVDTNNEAYFIDKTGSKVMVSKEKYAAFGMLVGDCVDAINEKNKYVYLDQSLVKKEMSQEYDFASSFNYGIAAIKTDNEWTIINYQFKVVSDGYKDIKMDEKRIVYRNDRLFVSKNTDMYCMIDENANQIGNDTFEDAKVFLGEGPTAVKISGKWRFVDKNNEYISENTYDDARPFSNGIAAVCVDGKWGFVDENERIVIEPQFRDAKDFNDKGSCFVKTGDKWQLLKLYRLNREG